MNMNQKSLELGAMLAHAKAVVEILSKERVPGRQVDVDELLRVKAHLVELRQQIDRILGEKKV